MANMNEMREFVAGVYPGSKWRNRVERMCDNQIIALYHKLTYLKKPEKIVEETPNYEPVFEPYTGDQMKIEGLG